MSEARVGVIVPVFNGEKYVANALRSLLRETGVGLQIIVVDDGSADGSREIVRGIARSHPSVRLVEADHGGVSRARNMGFAALDADVSLVTYLDCDDLNPPGRICRQARLIDQHPGVQCVVGLMQFFETESPDGMSPMPGTRVATVRGVQLSSGLFARELVERIGGFAEDMRHAEDVDFFLRMLEAGERYLTEDQVAVFYRRHSDNVTNDIARVRHGFMDAIRRSLARRRAGGTVAELGTLFKVRSEAERMFRDA